MSEPKQIQNQFIIASISEIRIKGTAPFDLVKNDIEIQVRKEKKTDKISGQINKIKSGISTIQDLGLKLGTVVETTDHITFNSYSLPNIGIEPDVIAYATVSPKNKISDPIDGNNGVYVIYVTDTEFTPIKDYNNEKLSINNMLSQRTNYDTRSTLLKLANISDKRIKFY